MNQPDKQRVEQEARKITGPDPDLKHQDQYRLYRVPNLCQTITQALLDAEERGRKQALQKPSEPAREVRLHELAIELCDALVGQGSAGAVDSARVDAAHAKLFYYLISNRPRNADKGA